MSEVVIVLQEPNYEYVPTLDRFAYVKIESVRSSTKYDNYASREIVLHRTLYAESLSGEWEPLYTVPFGLKAVSGDIF